MFDNNNDPEQLFDALKMVKFSFETTKKKKK